MYWSARLMMGTKQFQGCPAASGLGTQETVWMTVTSSGDTIMSLLLPIAALSCWIVLATVRGVALQLSISKSTPSSPNVERMLAKVDTKLEMVDAVENTKPQLPFCPPTEISTFFPLLCHPWTRLVGKLAVSTKTVPSGWGLAKANMTNFTLGFTSSVVDCPQQSMPNPQQKIETGVVACAMSIANARIMRSFIQNKSEWLQIVSP